MHQTGQSVRVFRVCALMPGISAHRKLFPHHKTRFLLNSDLAYLAACLTMIFVSCVALEAFDKDVALWPFGTEAFAAPAQDDFVGGFCQAGSLCALRALYAFVMTAGAQLVLRYRARSALVTDGHSPFVAFHRAEPWGVAATGAPALGPYISGPDSTADA